MKYVWLDTDPGHDDACAILLAANLPDNINLVGISTVHGNASALCTFRNANRLLYAFGSHLAEVNVLPGASRPLLRPSRADPEIHGEDGLGGVVGLPTHDHPDIQKRLARASGLKAVEGMKKAVQAALQNGTKITLVACGPLTNVALFIAVYSELLEGVEEICFMGGGVGIGNRSPVAEFNILCDPEAAQIVFDADIRKIMIPLNITHQAILTKSHQLRLKGHKYIDQGVESPTIPPSTPLRHTLSTLLSFFAESYRTTFGFETGPPLHDALTIAYVAHPELFGTTRYRVDVDCSSNLSVGQTVVDVFNYRTCDDSWGPRGKNVLVADNLDVPKFFDLFFECIDRCDEHSPLNHV